MIRDALRVAREAAERGRGESRYEAAVDLREKVVQIRPDDAAKRLQWANDPGQVRRIDTAISQCQEAAGRGAAGEGERFERERAKARATVVREVRRANEPALQGSIER